MTCSGKNHGVGCLLILNCLDIERGKNTVRSYLLLLFLLLAVVSLGGCTHSSLHVNSDPPGAEVFFNGKPQGVTPVEIPFQWYGGHRIKLRKEGYEELDTIEMIRAPLHYQVPFDLVTTMIPVTIRDRQERSYTLHPLVSNIPELDEP